MEKTGESYEEAEKFYSPDKPGPKKIKTKVKGKLNTESPLIKEIMTDNNLTEADVQDMTAKDFFDRYDSMKPEGQEFRADDIDTSKVTSYGAMVEAAKPDFLEYVTDPETLKKAGKVGIALLGKGITKIPKFAKNIILPGSTQEAAVDLGMTLQDKAREEFKQTPEYQDFLKRQEEEKRTAAALDLYDMEKAIQEDSKKPEKNRIIGDKNPTSDLDRQLNEILF